LTAHSFIAGDAMKYGVISQNETINAAIYRCFEFLPESDANAYVKKFERQPHDRDQVMHTLRELILGAFLASEGLTVASDRKINRKTPDWSVVEDDKLKCIIEVVNFDTTDAAKASAIHANIAGQAWTFMYQPDHTDRMYESLRVKCSKYRDIVAQHEVPYIPAQFPAFDAAVSPDQVHRCLYGDAGLFQTYPHVSGVLVFNDSKGGYNFKFHPNPNAIRPFHLPEGTLASSFFRQPPGATDAHAPAAPPPAGRLI
jgi:hypothetical protein